MPLNRYAAVATALGIALAASGARAADVKRAPFGKLADGTLVEAVTLTGADGVSARILTYGATLQSFRAPDRDGRVDDIDLGHDDLQSYIAKPNYFGGTIGRYANRIAGGRFTLDGKPFQLSQNDARNSLHGGPAGFDKRVWQIAGTSKGPKASVTFTLTSPNGDQGYPGKLDVRVTYALDDKGSLTITFDAKSDAPTVVNLTNHALFNLAGRTAPNGVLGHRLTIPASRYTPVDASLIPTGERKPVAGTVFDFTRGRTIADGIRDARDPQIVAGRGYDHNFALDKGATATPELAARLEDPASGRVLEVLSTEPGLQVYTGNFIDGTLIGKGGTLYRMGDGIALEPQKFPDTPNQPAFGSARVEPGKPYRHVMIYRVSTTR